MGADLYICGIVPKDSKYDKMAEIWFNCEELGIPMPKEVCKFFDGEIPNNKGIRKNIDTENVNIFEEVSENGFSGYDIDLNNLRIMYPDILVLRVGISY